MGLRARGSGLRLADVQAALDTDRSIVRTWLMRGTLHLVAAEDIRWLLTLLGPVSARADGARRRRLGLDEDLVARGTKAIREILAGGPLTRSEIVQRLRRFGIRLDPTTQAPIHLIAAAASRGICCPGPDSREGGTTYVLLDDWIPQNAEAGKTSGELAVRYFQAYGPASLADFAAWSGLPMSDARAGLTAAIGGLQEVRVQGQATYLAKGRLQRKGDDQEGAPNVRLLPALDTYLLGYRSRDLAVPKPLQRRLHRGGGWIHPAVVVDGRAIAAWKLRKTGRRSELHIEGVKAGKPGLRSAIESEARDIGRFLSLSAAPELLLRS